MCVFVCLCSVSSIYDRCIQRVRAPAHVCVCHTRILLLRPWSHLICPLSALSSRCEQRAWHGRNTPKTADKRYFTLIQIVVESMWIEVCLSMCMPHAYPASTGVTSSVPSSVMFVQQVRTAGMARPKHPQNGG